MLAHNSGPGSNRLVYADENEPRALKFNPVPPDGSFSANRTEWLQFSTALLCPEDLPTCYGFAQLTMGALQLEALIVERIAFNLRKSMEKMFVEPLSQFRFGTLLHMFHLTLTALRKWSTQHEVQTVDWHTGNINFTDTDPMRFSYHTSTSYVISL